MKKHFVCELRVSLSVEPYLTFDLPAAALDRDFLLGRERERKLQVGLEAARVRLLGQKRLNLELRARQKQRQVTAEGRTTRSDYSRGGKS